MPNDFNRCRRPRPSFDDHEGRVAAGICLLDTSNPCSVCENWPVQTWNKLRKALADARTKANQRGKTYWTSAFSQIEAWITRCMASIAGSDFSSLADSESSAKQNLGTEGSIVGDLKVHEIERNAKMADLTRAPLAHQVTPMAHLETIEAPMAHPDTIEAPRAHIKAPTAPIEVPMAQSAPMAQVRAPISHIEAPMAQKAPID